MASQPPALERALERSGDTDYRIPEGESRNEVTGRVESFLEEMGRKHRQGRNLVVTHGGVLSIMVRQVLHILPEYPRRFFLPNAALNIFEYKDGNWFVKTLGEVFFHAEDDLGDGIQ